MRRFIGPVTLILAIVSLVVSGFILYGLLRVRQFGLTTVIEARTALSGLGDRAIETSIPFHEAVPIEAHVPLEQEFVVPIQTTIPFSTVVRVPIEVPLLGTRTIAVPVEAEVPVNLQVVIPISQTVEVKTAVMIDTQVPVRVEMRQLGLGDLVMRIDAALARIERGLRWPAAGP